MKTAHQGVPVAGLPSGAWRAAAPEPARLADSVLNLFGGGPVAPPPPRVEPQAAPPRSRAASGAGEQSPERPVHGLEALLPPEDIPTGGTKRGERRAPPRGEEKNFFEKLFGG